jgi:hypothetical protein
VTATLVLLALPNASLTDLQILGRWLRFATRVSVDAATGMLNRNDYSTIRLKTVQVAGPFRTLCGSRAVNQWVAASVTVRVDTCLGNAQAL